MTEQKILQMMKSLDLTREEAIELLAEDEAVDKMTMKEVSADLTAEQKKAVKEATKTGSKKRTTAKRERKVDEAKKVILEGFAEWLTSQGADVEALKNEAEMHFNLDGTSYTVRLVKHRPPKEK